MNILSNSNWKRKENVVVKEKNFQKLIMKTKIECNEFVRKGTKIYFKMYFIMV